MRGPSASKARRRRAFSVGEARRGHEGHVSGRLISMSRRPSQKKRHRLTDYVLAIAPGSEELEVGSANVETRDSPHAYNTRTCARGFLVNGHLVRSVTRSSNVDAHTVITAVIVTQLGDVHGLLHGFFGSADVALFIQVDPVPFLAPDARSLGDGTEQPVLGCVSDRDGLCFEVLPVVESLNQVGLLALIIDVAHGQLLFEDWDRELGPVDAVRQRTGVYSIRAQAELGKTWNVGRVLKAFGLVLSLGLGFYLGFGLALGFLVRILEVIIARRGRWL